MRLLLPLALSVSAWTFAAIQVDTENPGRVDYPVMFEPDTVDYSSFTFQFNTQEGLQPNATISVELYNNVGTQIGTSAYHNDGDGIVSGLNALSIEPVGVVTDNLYLKVLTDDSFQVLASAVELEGADDIYNTVGTLSTWNATPPPAIDIAELLVAPNTITTPSSSEWVTMGLPFNACEVGTTAEFKLMDENGTEVPIFIKPTMTWHNRAACPNSPRSVKVQFAFDATDGQKIYTWSLDGRSTTDLSEQPISEVLTDRVALKGNLNEPRVFVIASPSYLVNSGIHSPTALLDSSSYDAEFYPRKWAYDQRDWSFVESGAANWLYDRPTTNYRQAVRAGYVDYYREAYLAHEFWIDKMEDTGLNTAVVDYCIGGFDMDGHADTFGSGGSGCDAKYMYTQPEVLHLALTGDDSWQPEGPAATTREEMWKQMATTVYTGANRCPTEPACQSPAISSQGFSSPYVDLGTGYTERNAGFGFQLVLGSCQLTGDPTICGWLGDVVDVMYDHQTNNPDGYGNSGGLRHSWHRHEGSFVPWIGNVVQAYTDATTIVVENVIGPATPLVAGSAIRVPTVVSLTADAVDNGDGTWTLQTSVPVTMTDGYYVRGGDEGAGTVLFELASDRVFSPWMLSIVGSGLWNYYHWTDDAARKTKVEALLKGFGEAFTANAIDGTRTDATTELTINNAFDVVIVDSDIKSKLGCNTDQPPYPLMPYPRYVGNQWMNGPQGNAEYISYVSQSGGFSDLHLAEEIFAVSVGAYFQDDPTKQAAMLELIPAMAQWFNYYACTVGDGVGTNDPPRAFSWQSQPDPWGTYQWVLQQLN